MRQFTAVINGKEYLCQTACAKNQFEALHIAGRTGLIAMLKDDSTTDMTMVVILLQIPFEDVKRLVSLLVDKCVTKDSVPVAENLFVDDISNYYLLIAKVIRENLAGFWLLQRPNSVTTLEQNS